MDFLDKLILGLVIIGIVAGVVFINRRFPRRPATARFTGTLDATSAAAIAKAEADQKAALWGMIAKIVTACIVGYLVYAAFNRTADGLGHVIDKPSAQPRNSENTPWVDTAADGNRYTQDKFKEDLLKGLETAYDIPFDELQTVLDESGGKPGENFRVELWRKYGIKTPDNSTGFARDISDLPIGTKIKIPLLFTKAWSRPISAVDWAIEPILLDKDASIEFMFRITWSQNTYKDILFQEKGYSQVASDGKLTFIGKDLPLNFLQGSVSVRFALPQDYVLPKDKKGVEYRLTKSHVRL